MNNVSRSAGNMEQMNFEGNDRFEIKEAATSYIVHRTLLDVVHKKSPFKRTGFNKYGSYLLSHIVV